MINKEKYLKKLQKELDHYTKQLSIIQNEFREGTEQDVERIDKSLQNILNKAVIAYGKLEKASAKEWEPLKNITNEAFANLKAAIEEKIAESENKVAQGVRYLDESYHEHLEQVTTYVKEHPIKSLLIAAGAGFILGKIFKCGRD